METAWTRSGAGSHRGRGGGQCESGVFEEGDCGSRRGAAPETWLDAQKVRPRIVGEFENSALMEVTASGPFGFTMVHPVMDDLFAIVGVRWTTIRSDYMASASQIRAMLQSHGSGDEERFYAVALQMAAAEARKGHERLAKEIRTLVEKAKLGKFNRKATASIVPLARPQGEVADLLEEVQKDVRADDLILSQPLKDRIDRILEEQRHLTRLKEHGLRPRQRLLFTGPPGCGKTMTASAIATELSLSLFVVRLDSLITRYLGDSLSKLRLVFDAVNHSRAVYLFDEFDSIGYTRDSGQDVGEMRRLLNSFLMFIEKLTSNSLVIAATNHGNRLDKALYRRFDDLVEFGLPGESEIWSTILARLSGVKTSSLEQDKILKASSGLSFAEITRACEEAVKEMLIRGIKSVSTDMLLSALTERRLFLNH